ncbi:MAG TPA: CGNR zinc finger domain-containing protein [Actinophytocola sp.]|uniref:CGNR zinc finger domain-containing protein n=1 Tax=Actinophytocola sp. TaxID=1872138 RepID=UPI002DDD0722|nr:CGNR zinc finger domain-containing protein [Actinophytocola sp.]HEV2779401.1 CGNR zinc finger domain-containing protein [Actinophytocola sp.]
MQFNPYGGTAAQLAAALVNAGPRAEASTINGILTAYDYRPAYNVDPAQTRELTRWAQRLRAVFYEPDPNQRVQLINELLTAVAAAPYISQHDGRAPHFHYAEHDAPLVHRIKAYTAAGLAHALCDDPTRIGHCHRPHCPTVFIDTSRNARRRFCTPRCANRTHVAHHRERQQTQPPTN